MNKTSEKQLEHAKKYNEKNTKMYPLKVNKKTESDIFEILENQPNVNGFIKGLIRKYAESN